MDNMKIYAAALFMVILSLCISAATCTVNPQSQTVVTNTQVQFTLSVDNSNYNYLSSCDCGSGNPCSPAPPVWINPSSQVIYCSYATSGQRSFSAKIEDLSTYEEVSCSAFVTVNAAPNPPQVSILQPQSSLQGGQSFSFSGTASDDSGITAVKVKICCPTVSCGSESSATLSNPGATSTNWNYAWVAPNQNQNCKIVVYAVDNTSPSGLRSNLQEVYFTTSISSTPTPIPSGSCLVQGKSA
ncbi:MAG: hypothetical protein ACP5IG_04710, partial [Candidatus Micrarchaeia archaeon]